MASAFDQEVKDEAVKLMSNYGIYSLLSHIKAATRYDSGAVATYASGTIATDLEDIALFVADSAAKDRLNAGYSGSHGDGGAGRKMDELKGYLEGVMTGIGGAVGSDSLYAATLKVIRRDQDPEYKKYLELKEKFGDK